MNTVTLHINISKAAERRAAAVRREPYWHSLGKHRALGFRKTEERGYWIARHQLSGVKSYSALGSDDAMGFDEAKRAAEKWLALAARGADATLSVEEALNEYEADRCRDANDRQQANAKTDASRVRVRLGKLAAVPVAALTTRLLENWLNGQEDLAPASRRRIWATLHAALDAQVRHGADPHAWRSAKRVSVPIAGRAREFIPSREELQRLIGACEEDFAPLVRAAAATGARYGELVTARVRDFDADKAELHIEISKTGARVMRLSSEAVGIIRAACKDKLPGAYIFLKADGEPWGKSEQHRRIRRAARSAKLPRSCVFYSLRHYALSTQLAAGVPSALVAKNAGTSELMLRQHYAKHSQDGNAFEKVRALA